MQLKWKPNYFWVVAALLLATLPIVRAANGMRADGDAFEKLVSTVYQRYAWVAVFGIDPVGAEPLANASQDELRSIFAPELANAIWSDARCSEERGEICRLDFDILFDSQDPSGASDLKVKFDVASNDVLVCFRFPSGENRCLTFVQECFEGRPKVADIVYPAQYSLRELLGLTRKVRSKPCGPVSVRYPAP